MPDASSVLAAPRRRLPLIAIRRMALAFAVGALLALAGGESRAAVAFDEWLAALRQDARAAGVSERTLERALSDVAPIPRVIELDRRQPEGRMTFVEYRDAGDQQRANPQGPAAARRSIGTCSPAIEARYGVPAEVIVALWGIESNFGENTGGFPVIASLATLAHEGRRAEFFKRRALECVEASSMQVTSRPRQ
jgi:membrane-bound lytic murein transglycosylase B